MRLLKGCFLIAFLLSVYSPMYAQNESGIHGKVYGENKQPAEAANVILLAAADSSIVKSTICDDNGEYHLAVKPGKYLLLISRLRYDQSLTGPYIINDGDDLSAGDVVLVLHTPLLKEVTVTAQRQYIDVRPDKVVLNLNSLSSDGRSAFDILREQAPGVHADTKGNLSLIGHANALVTVDGKQVRLSGQDLVDYLQSLPGNTIKQIELITSPSAKYDAAGAGIINIVSKRGTAEGTNFAVSSTAGYGTYGKAGAGINFNSQHKNLNVFGNYNFNYDKTDHVFLTNRDINYKGVVSDYDVRYNTVYQGSKQNYSVGADYAISKKHTIGILVEGVITNNNYSKNNHLNMSNDGVLDSTISTKSRLHRRLSNSSYDVNYVGKLDTNGRMLSADLVYNDIERDVAEYIDNYFNNSSGLAYRPMLSLQNLSPADTHIWSAKVDYVHPLSKTSRLEAGVKYSLTESNNQLIFGPEVDGVYQSSPRFSSTFDYKENVNSGYINYAGKLNNFSITAGLRLEQTNTSGHGNSALMNSDVEKHYLSWIPRADVGYRIDDKQSLDLNFSRSISRPDFAVVNPFLSFADLYDYNQGNPNIAPAYTNYLSLSHTYGKYMTTLYASVTNNFYDFTGYLLNDSSKVSRSVKQNFGKLSVYGIRFYVPIAFTNWWESDNNIDASYQRTVAYPKFGNLNKGTQWISFVSTQRFKLSETFTADIGGRYDSPAFYGIGQFKADYYVRAGLSKRILHNNGTLTFNASDIFNTHRDWSNISYQNLHMTVYDKIETRRFYLTFTYRFGNVTLKSAAKHRTGNEDEQKRATGSQSEVAGN